MDYAEILQKELTALDEEFHRINTYYKLIIEMHKTGKAEAIIDNLKQKGFDTIAIYGATIVARVFYGVIKDSFKEVFILDISGGSKFDFGAGRIYAPSSEIASSGAKVVNCLLDIHEQISSSLKELGFSEIVPLSDIIMPSEFGRGDFF